MSVDAPQSKEIPGTRPTPPRAADPADNVTWTGWVLNRLLRMCLLFLVYALSIGPLYWQWYEARVGVGSPALAMFYGPLEVLANWNTPFREWMDWYVNLWIV